MYGTLPVTLVEKNTAKILEFVVFLSYHMTIPIDDNVPFAALPHLERNRYETLHVF
jgi:hypothetical protein